MTIWFEVQRLRNTARQTEKQCKRKLISNTDDEEALKQKVGQRERQIGRGRAAEKLKKERKRDRGRKGETREERKRTRI